MPMRSARARSSSLRNCSMPCMSPPKQRSAAAASTPSGAPPTPSSTSMPVAGSAVAIAPPTSPSVISRMRTPALRTSATSSSWRGRSRMTAVRSADAHALGLGDRRQVVGGAAADVDRAARDRPDRDLVHVRVGRVQELAVLGHRDDGQRVVDAVGAQVGALQRIDGDVDLGRVRVAVADLLADVEHRRLVALALADDDAAADVHVAEGAAHGLGGGAVGAVACSRGRRSGPQASAAASVTRTTSSARFLSTGSSKGVLSTLTRRTTARDRRRSLAPFMDAGNTLGPRLRMKRVLSVVVVGFFRDRRRRLPRSQRYRRRARAAGNAARRRGGRAPAAHRDDREEREQPLVRRRAHRRRDPGPRAVRVAGAARSRSNG